MISCAALMAREILAPTVATAAALTAPLEVSRPIVAAPGSLAAAPLSPVSLSAAPLAPALTFSAAPLAAAAAPAAALVAVPAAAAPDAAAAAASPTAAAPIAAAAIPAPAARAAAAPEAAGESAPAADAEERGSFFDGAALTGALLAAPALAHAASAAHAPGRVSAVAPLAAAAALWGWWRGSSAPRDAALTNRLLAAARDLSKVPGSGDAAARAQAAALTGDYGALRAALKGLPEHPAVAQLRALAPKRDAADARQLAADLRATGDASGDPFALAERVSRLLDGIDYKNAPEALHALTLRLAKKASTEARARGVSRVGAPTGPVQAYNDCWVRVLYATPALERFRAGLSYEEFLAQIESEFPERGIRRNGLGFADFRQWLERRGLKAEQRTSSAEGLAELLASGPVIGAVSWFDADVSAMRSTAALTHFHQHAILITGVTGPVGARLFTVQDSLLPHESRYTIAELELMQLAAYVVSPR